MRICPVLYVPARTWTILCQQGFDFLRKHHLKWQGQFVFDILRRKSAVYATPSRHTFKTATLHLDALDSHQDIWCDTPQGKT
jgi:hypothetical protein